MERRQRRAQSEQDRQQADLDDAVFQTAYGGDINMMDKHDW